MLFRKKKRMIDVRELQKRGVVRIPKNDIEIPTNSEGFIELGQNSKNSTDYTLQTTKNPNSVTNRELFNFGTTTHNPQPTTNFSDSSEGYNKREVDSKIIDLDNKIYKLEQRLELLERKLGVSQQNTGGLIGW